MLRNSSVFILKCFTSRNRFLEGFQSLMKNRRRKDLEKCTNLFCTSSENDFFSLKWDFVALTMNIISIRKRSVATAVVSDVTCNCTCGHTIFMTQRYPLNSSDVI